MVCRLVFAPRRCSIRWRTIMHSIRGQYLPSGSRLGWAQLTNRSLIRVTGPDTIEFLQGLVTNDTRYLEQYNQNSIYALMLNNKGRVMYDLLVHKVFESHNNEDLLIECDRTCVTQLADTLFKYRLRKKVDLVGCSDTLSVYAFFPKSVESLAVDKDADELYLTSYNKWWDGSINPFLKTSDYKPVVWSLDPRYTALGSRLVIPNDAQPRDYVQDVGPDECDENVYHQVRYLLGIPEGTRDMPSTKSLPLESNGDYLNGISFHKGCYIGQELTARTHHTGVVRKRLMPIRVPMADAHRLSQVSTDAKIYDGNGKENSVGKFRASDGRFGLALMNVDKALAADKLLLELEDGDLLPVETCKPTWWKQTELTGEVRGFQPLDAIHK